jgi:type II secretory pathway predicted ATPase ExeA
LIHALLNYLDEKTKTAFIFHTNITFEELLKNILVELKLPVGEEGKTAYLRVLNDYLLEKLSRGENLAIIIDEAQNLSKEVLEELRMLSNLETSKSKLLQILLVGQPELETKLNSQSLRQLKQRIGIRRKISPLSMEESSSYIDHRLKMVGSTSSKIFTSEAVSLICDYARGVPRTINIICDNALLIGYSLSQKRVGAKIIREVIEDMEISAPEKSPSLEPFLADGSQTHIKSGVINHGPKTTFSNARAIILFILLFAFCIALFLILDGKHIKKVTSTLGNHFAVKKFFSRILPNTTNPASSEPISTSQPAIHELKPADVKNGFPKESLTGEGKVDSAPFTNTYDNQVLSGEPKPISTPISYSSNSLTSGIKNDSPSSPDTESSIAKLPLENGKSPKPKNGIKRIVTIKKKESLFYLARQHYSKANETVVDFILESNPHIGDAHLIYRFQEIRIPEITEESLIIQQPDHTYKIHLGTFLNPESVKIYIDEPALKGKTLETIPKRVAPKETWFRIMAGRFKDKNECLKVISILRKRSLLPCLAKK